MTVTPNLQLCYSVAGQYCCAYDMTDYDRGTKYYNRVLTVMYLDGTVINVGNLGSYNFKIQWPNLRGDRFKAVLTITELMTGETQTIDEVIGVDSPENVIDESLFFKNAGGAFSGGPTDGSTYTWRDEKAYPLSGNSGLGIDNLERYVIFRRYPTDLELTNDTTAFKLIHTRKFNQSNEIILGWFNESKVEVTNVWITKDSRQVVESQWSTSVLPPDSVLTPFYGSFGQYLGTGVDPLENPDAAPNYDAMNPEQPGQPDQEVLTIRAALVDLVQSFQLSNVSINKALIDAGLIGALAYTKEHEQLIDMCLARFLLTLIPVKQIKEGEWSTTFAEFSSLRAVISTIHAKWNLADPFAIERPTVKRVRIW